MQEQVPKLRPREPRMLIKSSKPTIWSKTFNFRCREIIKKMRKNFLNTERSTRHQASKGKMGISISRFLEI
jgi:hypothetical protein